MSTEKKKTHAMFEYNKALCGVMNGYCVDEFQFRSMMNDVEDRRCLCSNCVRLIKLDMQEQKNKKINS